MHFWIDKRATSFQYGRRRPTFYSSGTFASSAFGGDRRDRRSGRPSQASTSATSSPVSTSHLDTLGEDQLVRLPRQYFCPSAGNHTRPNGRRSDNVSMPSGSSRSSQSRRPSAYPPIPDPSVQEALDELQQELQASLLSPSRPIRAAEERRRRRFCITTKHLGLTLCVMGFILLCTVAGKFVVEGPGVIDASRRPISPLAASSGTPGTQYSDRTSVSFFFISEVLFVAFALGLFLTGVSCLRKRTNEYLLHQFRQHIISSSHHQQTAGSDGIESSSRSSGTTLLSMSDEETGPPIDNMVYGSDVASERTDARRHHHRYILETAGMMPGGISGRHRRYCQQLLQKQRPPPYDVAIYLPLPNQELPNHASVLSPPLVLDSQILPAPFRTVDDGTNSNSDSPVLRDKGDQKEKSESMTTTPSGTETPPPAYELQFSYEI